MTHQPRHQPHPFSVVPKAQRDAVTIVIAGVGTIFLLAFVAVLAWAWRQAAARYTEFMTECEQDHKHYECMLLWRAPPPIAVQVPR